MAASAEPCSSLLTLAASLEYQPVLIVSVGGREPSGYSGRNVLLVRIVIMLLITWIITHNLVRTK